MQKTRLLQPAETPTTWLVRASDACPAWIRGSHPTVAIRITDHPLLRELCESLELPLVSTSANRAAEPTATSVEEMERLFGDELDCIVRGYETGGAQASTIKSLETGALLRS